GESHGRAGEDHRARARARDAPPGRARGRGDLRSDRRAGRVRGHAQQPAQRNEEARPGVDREGGATVRTAAAADPIHILGIPGSCGSGIDDDSGKPSDIVEIDSRQVAGLRLKAMGETMKKAVAVALLMVLVLLISAGPSFAWGRGGGNGGFHGHGGFHGRGVVVVGGCCWGWGWGWGW